MPTLDFRNGRYQGECLLNNPDGVGIYFDCSLMFCLAQWRRGHIQGACFIIFPDGKLYCGTLFQGTPQGVSMFYLQDKTVVYVNHSNNNSVAVLPELKLLLKIGNADGIAHSHHNYNTDQYQAKLMEMLQVSIKQGEDWKEWVKSRFMHPYGRLIEFFQIKREQRVTEWCVQIRKKDGLRIGAWLEERGKEAVVRSIGCYNANKSLQEIGFRKIQGFKEEISVKYEKERPKLAWKSFKDTLKKSMNYIDRFLETEYIFDLEKVCVNVTIRLVFETQRVAQIRLEKPNQAPIVLAQVSGMRKGNNEISNSISNGISKDEVSKPYLKSQFNLTSAKEAIYKSIDKIKRSSPETKHLYWNKTNEKKEISGLANPQNESYASRSNYSPNAPAKSVTPLKYRYTEEAEVSRVSTKSRPKYQYIEPDRHAQLGSSISTPTLFPKDHPNYATIHQLKYRDKPSTNYAKYETKYQRDQNTLFNKPHRQIEKLTEHSYRRNSPLNASDELKEKDPVKNSIRDSLDVSHITNKNPGKIKRRLFTENQFQA